MEPCLPPRVRCLAGTTIGALLMLAGCAGGDGPPEQVADSRGAELYQANCASCHGEDLRGTERGPSHLDIVYEPGHHGDNAFRSAIDNGTPQHHWNFGDMPPVEGLTPSEVDAIIGHVREVQEREGFER